MCALVATVVACGPPAQSNDALPEAADPATTGATAAAQIAVPTAASADGAAEAPTAVVVPPPPTPRVDPTAAPATPRVDATALPNALAPATAGPTGVPAGAGPAAVPSPTGVAVAPTAAPASSPSSHAVQTANGAEVYTNTCANCHGENGLGSQFRGIFGASTRYTTASLVDELTNGHPYTFGFADKLSADEIASVVAYVLATF